MATIYLSSTYEDLKDYRKAVTDTLRQAGHQVTGMEDYAAAPHRPVEICLKDVEAADLYVGLFAFRYGYVPPAEHGNPGNLSITELEFRHAESQNRPCLIFVVEEHASWPRFYDDACMAEDKGARIRALRQRLLTEKLAKLFSQPHELSAHVLAAVSKHLGTPLPSVPSPAKALTTGSAVIWDIDEQKDGSPYPGLLHFTRKYARVFFGRESEVGEILDRLRHTGFLIISGDSGVGKSSVVDAGVLPRLETGGLPNAQPCVIVRMVPSQRQQPMEAFLGALSALISQAGLRPDTLLDDLTQAPETLGARITTLMKAGDPSRALVLFLDQMEELFTAQEATQANRFLTALYQAAQEQALWVIGTIRSDHLHHCHRHPEMLNVLNGPVGHYALGAAKPYMIRDMIVNPAQAAGLTISEDFAARLIRESEAEAGNLPLLAFVLDQLFHKRADHTLSEAEYDRLGGVAGAIGAHVKAVETTMERQWGIKAAEVMPVLFQRLAKVQKEEGMPTRNRQKKADFPNALHPVIDRLVTERLLRTEGEKEDATVSISHEKLFEAWPALKDYVENHKKALVDRTLLESRAQKWAALGKPWSSGLATGREYHDFQQAGVNTGGLVNEFLKASQRWRQLWMAGGVLVLVVIGGITWLWQKGYDVNQALLKIQSLVVSIHVPPEMVPIPGGKYQQGDVEGLGESWRNPVREVTIQPVAMGKHEVTFEEYDRFAIATNRRLPEDQGWGRGQRPVINVTWENARDYAKWLSEETGEFYRLPTESEWEYAARSGDKQDAWAGTSEESQLGDYAVYVTNSGNRTAEVGSKAANGFGLKDLSGNVWEWVEDCLHGTYDGAPPDGSAWLETNEGDCSLRVIRGGSWFNSSSYLRASNRSRDTIDFRNDSLGFRLVQDTP